MMVIMENYCFFVIASRLKLIVIALKKFIFDIH